MQLLDPGIGPVGQALDRADGPLKVTGRATYAAEAKMPGVVHAVLLPSTIAAGTIASVDTTAAEKSLGVLAVITHENIPKWNMEGAKQQAETRLPLSDNKVVYAGQHVAVVVADTLERARYAMGLIKVKYDETAPMMTIDDPRAQVAKPPKRGEEPLQFKKGDPEAALANADFVRITQTYTTPVEHHNPMELHATIANWDTPGRLTVWDSTQGVVTRAHSIAAAFGLKEDAVRVICPYIGGGFGSKGDTWPHTLLAVAAAKVVGEPVKLMVTRQQMFTSTGHRPEVIQKVSLAATKEGRLQAIIHDCTMHDSVVGKHVEPAATGTTGVMYKTESLSFSHTISKINISSATYMRAPGENPGTFALESALDELAYALNLDPLELRRINDADRSPHDDLPFSTKHTKECYDIGAKKFGWEKRNPAIGSSKTPSGNLLGWGVATATYPARRFPNQARIRVLTDGPSGGIRAIGQCATQDLGTGMWTVGAQMTATLTGLPYDKVKFELGDTTLPPGATSGGSASTAGVGQALSEAATKLRDALLALAQQQENSPLKNVEAGKVTLRGTHLTLTDDPSKGHPISELIARSGKAYVEGTSERSPVGADDIGSKRKKNTFQSFGVHFVEVEVEQPVPIVHVRRVVSVMDVGRIVNHKLAHSQVMGGIVMGVGQTLMEETHYDPRTYRPMNANLADYLVPVNPDIPDLDITLMDEPDMLFNAIGCRGIGEIGITGINAAIANAVYHATGKRIRNLPITPDKLL